MTTFAAVEKYFLFPPWNSPGSARRLQPSRHRLNLTDLSFSLCAYPARKVSLHTISPFRKLSVLFVRMRHKLSTDTAWMMWKNVRKLSECAYRFSFFFPAGMSAHCMERIALRWWECQWQFDNDFLKGSFDSVVGTQVYGSVLSWTLLASRQSTSWFDKYINKNKCNHARPCWYHTLSFLQQETRLSFHKSMLRSRNEYVETLRRERFVTVRNRTFQCCYQNCHLHSFYPPNAKCISRATSQLG